VAKPRTQPWDGGHGTASGRVRDVPPHRRASETATNRGSLRALHSRIDATLGPGAASKCCRCAGYHLARPPISFLTYQGLRASLRRRPDPWLNTDALSGACPGEYGSKHLSFDSRVASTSPILPDPRAPYLPVSQPLCRAMGCVSKGWFSRAPHNTYEFFGLASSLRGFAGSNCGACYVHCPQAVFYSAGRIWYA
jgi:hypothetical protein